MGDAVAFSASAARGLAQPTRIHSTVHRALPFCVLRVERRRSVRAVWERVLDEAVEVRKLNFVSQLERHRYEYRFALRNCDDPSVLTLPSELRAPRVQKGVGDHHPHIGSFQFVRVRSKSVTLNSQSRPISSESSSSFYVTTLVMIVVLSLVLRTGIISAFAQWAGSFIAGAAEAAKQWWQRKASNQGDEGKLDESLSVSKFAAHSFGNAAEVGDDETTIHAEKELLMTELPEFNDELGWRDFFDSQIYKSEAHRKQSDGEETSSKHPARLLISGPINGSDAMGSVRSTRLVPDSAKIAGLTSRGVPGERRADSTWMMGSRRAANNRKPRAETAKPPQTATVFSNGEPEMLGTKRSSSDDSIDDLGDFWEM